MRFVYVTLFALFAGANCSPPKHGHVVHEKREHRIDPVWTKTSRLPGDIEIPLRIALSQSNINKGHDMLMEVSDPYSPKYGQHYNAEEVVELFAPSKETIETVLAWLEDEGINERSVLSDDRQWLKLNTTVYKLEKLLHTSYYVYENSESYEKAIACEEYKIPAYIQHHIDYISPGIRLIPLPSDILDQTRPSLLVKRSKVAKLAPGCGHPNRHGKYSKGISPQVIQEMYKIPSQNPTRQPQNSFGVFESILQGFNSSDLNIFFTKYYPQIPNNTFPEVFRIDGAPPPRSLNGIYSRYSEGAEDIQAAYPIMWPDRLAFFLTDDFYYENLTSYTFNGPLGIFNTFFDAIDKSYCTFKAFGIKGDSPGIDPKYPDHHKHGYKGKLQCGKYEPTKVISFSYIEGEAILPMPYQRRQCLEFMKLGMQGITLVFASGDRGVAEHYNPEPHLCLGKGKGGLVFGPNTPVNCPYVTAVGGTRFDFDERAWLYSGGGFSNIYPRPKYQEEAVSKYFDKYPPPYEFYSTIYNKSVSPNGGLYNRAGRGYPDVAALSVNYVGIYEGKYCSSGGTSLSTPLWGAVITRINNARFAAGKSPVGFINPTLYAHPEMFKDITTGRNYGCATDGFSAEPGWDPVTGLGAPDFPALMKVFLSLP